MLTYFLYNGIYSSWWTQVSIHIIKLYFYTNIIFIKKVRFFILVVYKKIYTYFYVYKYENEIDNKLKYIRRFKKIQEDVRIYKKI